MSDSFLIVNPQWPSGTFLVPMLLAGDSDNRVYAVGFNSDSHEHYLTRLSAQVGPVDGVADVDSSFGDAGFVSVRVDRGLQIQRPLHIVEIAAAHLTVCYEVLSDIGLYQTALLRFLLDGQVDTKFGENGVALFAQLPQPTSVKQKILAQATGASDKPGKGLAAGQRLLVAYKLMFGQKFSYLVRVNADGSLDSSFAGGVGHLRLSFFGSSNDSEYLLAIDSSGRAVIVSEDEEGTHISAVRFTADGVLDSSFGGTGFIVISSLDGEIKQPAVRADAHDNVVISVKYRTFGLEMESLNLFRIASNGTADPSFNYGLPIQWLPDFDKALLATTHVAVDRQQRIVLRSIYMDRHTGERGVLISRFTARGIDSSFGESGSLALSGSGSFYGGLVIQSGTEGAIVISDRQAIYKIAR